MNGDLPDNSKRIASVSSVLSELRTQALAAKWGLATTTQAIRSVQSLIRKLPELPSWAAFPGEYPSHIEEWLQEQRTAGYEPVFNLTGTMLHTNLGRALLAPDAIEAMVLAAQRPMALEFDIDKGRRGDRERPVRERICQLFGCESSTVVNNNTAAVALILNTLARGADVLVSRGELVEIGGSFRLPEIMERSGCNLVEVGTTNRTRISDFSSNINERTALLFKVQASNFRIKGFTEEVSVSELAALSEATGIPLAVDLGSASSMNLSGFGLVDQLSPLAMARPNLLACFSGDKILGGPQCGIILGSRESVGRLGENPLKRALRADKYTLAALNATLRSLENPGVAWKSIPFLKALATPLSELERRGRLVATVLASRLSGCEIRVVDSCTQVGSGAHPDETVQSRSAEVECGSDRSARALASTFRSLSPPVLGRLHQHRLYLDMRGADPLDEILATLHTLE